MTSQPGVNAALIVDDHSLIVVGARNIIKTEAPMLDIVVCSNAEQTMGTLHDPKYRWNLILLDLDIPGAIGLSLAMEIKNLGLESVTCVLTGNPRSEFVSQIKANGFRGYILKGSQLNDLETSLKKVLSGYKVFPSIDIERPATPIKNLTERQVEILRAGLKSKIVANKLGLTRYTVDTHFKSIKHALGASSRGEALFKAVELGLVRREDVNLDEAGQADEE